MVVSSLVGPAGAQEPPATPDTLARIVPLPEIVISTTRPDERAPLARAKLTRAEIREKNWGQDTPMALATLPGAYAYSDAGNGIGYSYLSIRGFPQRRISVLVNGVPLNDPESHEVYWIDHPDLLASTAEVEMQRGVGSALYGAASVGGSVNLETSPFSGVRQATAALAYGSFDTRRLLLEMDSGPLADGWNLYGRYSRIQSDGYRDQSWTRLWSYALSARKAAGAHLFRANLYGGPEETHLSYLGVPLNYLDGLVTGDPDRDRRYNPITFAGEADHFFEPHYELIHSWSPGPGLALTHTLFYFEGSGYYDEQRGGQSLAAYRLAPWQTTDPGLFGRDSLVYYDNNGISLTRDGQGRVTVTGFDAVRRRWVSNRHFGWIPRVRIDNPRGTLTLGGEIRAHDGRHVGRVLTGRGLPPGTEPEHVYYDYHPRTLSAGLFARQEWRVTPTLQLTTDLAWRHQEYLMRGDLTDPAFHPQAIRFDQRYDFALPRVGLTWNARPEVATFIAWSHSEREPSFRDLYDAEGGGAPLFAIDPDGRYGAPLIRPERVHDFEAGAAWRRDRTSLGANLFRMNFRDELVYAGQFNTDLGYAIIGNAARSVHQGVELAGSFASDPARPVTLALDANATLSDNHFLEYREFIGPSETTSYGGNALGFFPAVVGNVAARAGWRGVTAGAEVQHVGRIYLDNTEDAGASIDPRTVLNLSGAYRLARAGGPTVELSVRLFNALDRRYAAGGYSYLFYDLRITEFIPAATRNALAQVSVEF
jgi:iron complex outermembrane receptor protein